MELKPLKTDVPVAHSIASHTDTTATGAQLNELVGGGNTTLHNHSALYQPLHANLTNFATLTYVADSFIAMSGANTFLLRTLAQTRADLNIDLVENTALTTWAGSGSITTVGALASGSIAAGFTSISTDYTDAKCTDAAADNTAANQTSHADVVIDGDFTSNGLLNRTGAGAYSIKVIGTDVQAYHANLAAIAGATWTGAASITTLGTIAAGTWAATDVAILHGGTGQSTSQLAINALTAVSAATNEHVLTKDTDTGNAVWKAAAGGADAFTVKVDAGATAGYIGAASDDGVLRVDGSNITYTDGGDFVTLTTAQGIQTTSTPQFAAVRIGHGSGNGSVDIARGGGTFSAHAITRTFAANTTLTSYWDFVKSHSDSLDTYVETIDDDVLGNLRFFGVDTVPSLKNGAEITAKQNGAAGTGFIPADLILQTCSSTGWNSNQLILHHDGGVGVGIEAPGVKLDVAQDNASFGLVVGADLSAATRTDETRKIARIGMPHYDNDEEYVSFLTGDSNGTDNIVTVGGGTTAGNAATKLFLRTAANDTTTGGSNRMKIDSDGGVFMYNLKSGTDQADAGAAADELYVDTNDDNTVKLGV